jgi:RNA polymerase sigma-70 factor, ECF subfamily
MTPSADQLYERVLILRGQTGDEAAFAELVERYHVRLRYYLRKMLGPDQADDALQEVWLDVFRALPRLADPGAFTAWLYRIARVRTYRVLRRRPPTQPLADVEPEAPEAEADFTAEEAAAIHAALDRLSPEHREALILRFVEDMSYEQIAAVAGVPVGTVRSRLHNAKRELRRLLERTNDHERDRTGPGFGGVRRDRGQ